MSPVTFFERVRGALWGIFIADALSMPAHWYYDLNALQRDFGYLTTYQAPKTIHPGSIMSLSNTGGHGRGGQSGHIIGDVINHGKHEAWGKAGVHYHQGMIAGENTLNALCARLVMRSIAAEGGYSTDRFLDDYVRFMTTPGSHNDTYAESFHRDFFSNWDRGVPPAECAGREAHNTATVGGLVMLPPVIIGSMKKGLGGAKRDAAMHLQLTHRSRELARSAAVYTELLFNVMSGEPLQEAALFAAEALNLDLDKLVERDLPDEYVIGRIFGPACYISDALPSILYLAYKYADSFEDAVVANTNSGGENCHRGSALGALLGAANGVSKIPPHFISGLVASHEIHEEIERFIVSVADIRTREL
ncbi:hypothetical protein CYMTET_45942 [Cymbomonas tetramitiformis]|uniref:ADP-ribosylglycohydrolase n=1 Tax=Cymbomonas tetramitiformis TaxID=36881 RepID=A0AAE0BYZ1_9CHLO|nr:hypothetical protein CYMTET_45942 [Cymbomonas tetramitiformis]